jgi:DNA repair exonuclease SbcCD ATPase subunit
MKTNYIKTSIWLLFSMFFALTTKAQTADSGSNAHTVNISSSYDNVRNDDGKRVETMEFTWNDKEYKATLVNDRLTELSVEGEKVAPADWSKYNDAIAAIKEQIAKNREQEKKNREQARLNEIQAGKNQEQARLNEIQEKKNEEQVARNREQDRLNEIQAQRNQEQAARNQEQAVRNKEQEEKNQEQAVKNQEQARRNEIQAKKNEEQAKENERFIKEITADLVADKIIPNADGLKDLTFNSDEMIVNGIKMSADVHQKYEQKYSGFVKGSFSFSNDGIIRGN